MPTGLKQKAHMSSKNEATQTSKMVLEDVYNQNMIYIYYKIFCIILGYYALC